MDKISIAKVSQNIFKPRSTENNQSASHTSNPFGINFKGNVLAADVLNLLRPKNQMALITRLLLQVKSQNSSQAQLLAESTLLTKLLNQE